MVDEELWQKYEHFGDMLLKAGRREWDADMCQNLFDAMEVMQEIINELSLTSSQNNV